MIALQVTIHTAGDTLAHRRRCRRSLQEVLPGQASAAPQCCSSASLERSYGLSARLATASTSEEVRLHCLLAAGQANAGFIALCPARTVRC